MVATSGARAERGAVAVEFALILPILVMLLLGITTAGLSYSQSIGLANAVREGSRFGATADAASDDWAADVISRVRTTQFDDSSTPPDTAVCVQLYKQGSGPVANRSECEAGDPSLPALSMPTSNKFPAVPATIDAGQCVVRVIAARPFSINIVIAPIYNGVAVKGAVARYERDSC